MSITVNVSNPSWSHRQEDRGVSIKAVVSVVLLAAAIAAVVTVRTPRADETLAIDIVSDPFAETFSSPNVPLPRG